MKKPFFKSLCFRKAYCVLVFFASNILGIPDWRSEILINSRTLLENLSDGANAYIYVTKIANISLYLTKLYVTRALHHLHLSHTVKSAQTFLKV